MASQAAQDALLRHILSVSLTPDATGAPSSGAPVVVLEGLAQVRSSAAAGCWRWP